MKKLSSMVVLSTIIVLSASSGSSTGQVVLPNYEQGNSWIYSSNMTYPPGFLLAGIVEMEITDVESVFVDSPYETLRNEIIGNGTFSGVYEGFNVSGNWTMVGLENWDVVSYEIVRSETTLVFRGIIDMGVPLNFYLSAQNTTMNSVTQDTWEHPFDVDDSGNATLLRTSNQTMLVEVEGSAPLYNSTDWSGTIFVTYSCTENIEVSVPAGSFLTHHVTRTESSGLVEDSYYSTEVGAGVQIERSIGGFIPVGEWDLLSYSYSAGQPAKDEGLPLLYWLIPVTIVIVLILIALFIERRRR
ncbi:MAG: hypothetical protein ACE5QF_00700 [Thermoplasmata archaeon]